MSDRRIYRLIHETARKLAAAQCGLAPDEWIVTFREPTRSLEQSAKFHAICGDIAKSGTLWAGKPRTAAQWKCLLVSGHAIATGEGAEIVPGIESEWINIRESTALMSKKRGSSLIEYSIAWCTTNNICIQREQGNSQWT